MAPVEPEALNSNVKALTLFSAHISAIVLVISIVARFLAKSTYDLPPAYHTRRRDKRYHRHITLFSILTALSFLVTVYHAIIWRIASYTSWAHAHRVNAPNTLWNGWYGTTLETGGWQLGRWMQDVDVRAETDDALFGTSKAMWWSYQKIVGIVTWSIFVGIEGELPPRINSRRAGKLTAKAGRHRKIPLSVTLSFIALAQLAGLSLAQNLFFLTMTVTHVPLDSGNLTTTQSFVFLIPALLSNVMTFYVSQLRTFAFWPTISALTYLVIPLLLSLLAQPNSLDNGYTHPDIHAARASYIPVFRILSWSSLTLNLYFGLAALFSVTPPESHLTYHHIHLHTGPLNTHPTYLEQASTAFTRIISLPSLNPILGAIAWDVLLSTLSLCLWSSTRPLFPRTMLQSAGLLWTPAEASNLTHTLSSAASSTGAEVGKRARNVSKKAAHVTSDAKAAVGREGKDAVEAPSSPATKRGRGRPRKSDSLSRTSGTAASAVATGSPTKRQRKAKSGAEAEEEDDDGEYVASPVTRRMAAKMAVEHDGFDDEHEGLEGSEAGALAWGLWVVGGLGTIMSAVTGAEVAGR